MYNHWGTQVCTMRIPKFFLGYILGIFAIVIHPASTEECDQRSGTGFIFPRSMTVIHDGPQLFAATRELVSQSLRNCIDLRSLGEKVISKFEAYGLDMRQAREDPYAAYETEDYIFSPRVRDPRNPNTILAVTLYDYAKYMDTPLQYVSWHLAAKRNLNGPKGPIPAGYIVNVGMGRFRMHGRSFCPEFYSRVPVTTSGGPLDNSIPIDLILEDDLLGVGAIVGLATRQNATVSGRWVILFPPKPP